MKNFKTVIEAFIHKFTYYPSWTALEKDLRATGNQSLEIKALEIVPLTTKNHAQYEASLHQETDFMFSPKNPFPIKLIHRDQNQNPIAITQIGQKKSKTPFLPDEIEALKKLHQYLNQQIQYLKNQDQITKNLNLQTQKFQAAHAKLQQSNQVKESFLSIASHELRTPMSVIRGYADFLLSENFGTLNDQQRSFIQKIMTNTNHLTNLVNNMLDVSKLEAGKMPFEMSDFDLYALIENTVQDHQVLLHEKQQTLEFSATQVNHPLVHADPEKVKLVLANLISNAYKFSPPKSQIIVRLAPQPQTDFWLISVTDTGIGIPETERYRLFEKFQQVDNSLQKKHAGTGLGLSICREIIEQMGGEIWVNDNPSAPSGAVFSFTLPA